MKEYIGYPPQHLFEMCLRNCPNAALLYKELWLYLEPKNSYCLIDKKDVAKLFKKTGIRFRTELIYLQKHEFLIFKTNKKTYKISLREE